MAKDSDKMRNFYSFALGDTSASAPATTDVVAGNHITWTGDWTEFAAYLSDDAIDFDVAYEALEVKPKEKPIKVDELITDQGILGFDVGVEQLDSSVLGLTGHWSVTSGVATMTATQTKKAAAFEINGVGCWYFPLVLVRLSAGPGVGYRQLGKYTLHCSVFGTTGIENGCAWRDFTGTT